MKKIVVLLFLVSQTFIQAQEIKQIPQISVNGQGKIKVVPDRAVITIGIQNSGKDAKTVKNENDITADKVIKFLKKYEAKTAEYKTTQVSLNQVYDYQKKQTNYQASQSITIALKDLSKYDEMIIGLMGQGVNRISNVEFKSSKMTELEAQARKEAVLDAKKKAEDFTSPLGQKVGKAIQINDNSAGYFPPMYKNAYAMEMAQDSDANRETIAIGEIEILVNVSVSFLLE